MITTRDTCCLKDATALVSNYRGNAAGIESKKMDTTTYNYEIQLWFEGQERETKFGKGGWDLDTAARRLNAAVNATDKVPGLMASGRVIEEAAE